MNRTRALVLAAALVVAVAVLAVVLISRNSSPDWEDVAVAKVGFTNNRSTVWAQTVDYHSDSCFNVRIDVDRGDDPWEVGVEVQRTSDFCTAEAAIGDPPSPAEGVVVSPHASDNPGVGHNILTVDLDSPAPADVTLGIE